MKRFLSLVLALAVVLCCQSAFAAVAFEKSVIYDLDCSQINGQ